MSDESVYPLLSSEAIIKKVLDIHKAHPELDPSEEDIHLVFDSNNVEFAKALYSNWDNVIGKAKKADYVSPNDPNLPKIVSGCSRSCKRGNCSKRCQSAMRIFSQMSNQRYSPEKQQPSLANNMRRMLGTGSRFLDTSKKNSRLQTVVSDIESQIESDVKNNPDNKAYVFNAQIRSMMLTDLQFDQERYKEKVLEQSALSPWNYTKQARASYHSLLGRGSAASDLGNAALMGKDMGSVMGRANSILSKTQGKGYVDDETRQEILKMMNDANAHVPTYQLKAGKLIRDDDFINGYIEELNTQANKWNKKMFTFALRDGTPESEMAIQKALKDIPSINKTATKAALEQIGREKYGDEAYERIFKSGVDGYLDKNTAQTVKSYGSLSSPEERKMLVADVVSNSQFYQNQRQEIADNNKKLQQLLGKNAPQYNIDNFASLPEDMQKDIAKGTMKDLYEKFGEAGIVKASKFFGPVLDDTLIQEGKKEYRREAKANLRSKWDNWQAHKKETPTLSFYKAHKDQFDDMSVGEKEEAKNEMVEELGRLADKQNISRDSDVFKDTVESIVGEFKPLSKQAMNAIKVRNDNFAKKIRRSDGVSMYYSDVFQKPVDFINNNPIIARKLSYDANGKLTEFGKYVEGLNEGVKAGYAHPLFGQKEVATAIGVQNADKTDDEIRADLERVINSVPAQYRDQIFSDRMYSFVYSPKGKLQRDDFQSFSQEQDYQEAAMRYGIDPMDQHSYDKVSNLVDKYAISSNQAPRNTTDVFDMAKGLENTFQNDQMDEQDLDDMYDSFKEARGSEYADSMLQKRYEQNRNGGDEGVELGIYGTNDSSQKRADKYKSYLATNGQFANMAKPTKARQYKDWRSYQIASGGDKALKNISNDMGISKNPIVQFENLEARLSRILSANGTSANNLSKIRNPAKLQEANEYLNAMMNLAMNDEYIGGKYQDLMNGGKTKVPTAQDVIGYASQTPTTQDDIAAFTNGSPLKVGNSYINSPFDTDPMINYASNSLSDRVKEISQAQSNIMSSQLPPTQKAYAISALEESKQLNNKLGKVYAQTGSIKQPIENEVSQAMSDLASMMREPEVTFNSAVDYAKNELVSGNTQRGMKAAGLLARLKDLFNLYSNGYGAYTTMDRNNFMNSTWNLKGQRQEPAYQTQILEAPAPEVEPMYSPEIGMQNEQFNVPTQMQAEPQQEEVPESQPQTESEPQPEQAPETSTEEGIPGGIQTPMIPASAAVAPGTKPRKKKTKSFEQMNQAQAAADQAAMERGELPPQQEAQPQPQASPPVEAPAPQQPEAQAQAQPEMSQELPQAVKERPIDNTRKLTLSDGEELDMLEDGKTVASSKRMTTPEAWDLQRKLDEEFGHGKYNVKYRGTAGKEAHYTRGVNPN